MIDIVYASPELIPSYYECLKDVAHEKIYLELVDPPPIERVTEFQMSLISKQGPIYYATEGKKVIGWCDVFPEENPRQAHRGSLGMGLLPSYRGKGVGGRLLEAVLNKAKEFGLEKVELNVYTSNVNAIKLYKRFGFIEEGLIRNYRKLDGMTFDCIIMAKFLS